MRLIEPQPIFYVAGLAVDADGVFRAYHPTKDHQFYPVLRVGHLLSFLAMIRSAIVIPSAMADSSAGEGRPSQFANCENVCCDQQHALSAFVHGGAPDRDHLGCFTHPLREVAKGDRFRSFFC